MSRSPFKNSSTTPSPPLLEVANLHWTIRNKSILSKIDLTVKPGDWVAVVGPNGAGKSSLLRCCLGWTSPSQGSVQVHGTSLGDYSPHHRAAKMAWLPQHTRLAEPMSVRNVVANARYRFSERRVDTLKAVHSALTQLGVDALSDRCWTTLSGGEQQRVNLATLIAQEAELWFLDEPANHLDPAVQQTVFQQLYTQWTAGQTLVMITHDLNLLLSTIPSTKHSRVRVLGLDNGSLQFLEPLDSKQLPRYLEALYKVSIAEITVFGRRHWVFGAQQ